MGTYTRIEDPDGRVQLVKRGSTFVRPGDVQVYLSLHSCIASRIAI
jgi:hypothetical protein